MKGKCSVWTCESEVGSGGHLFPKNLELRKKWLEAIKREDYQPGKWSKICSLHFKPTDFYTGNGSSRKILKQNAIPSILPKKKKKKTIFDLCEKKQKCKRRKRNSANEINTISSLVSNENWDSDTVVSSLLCENNELNDLHSNINIPVDIHQQLYDVVEIVCEESKCPVEEKENKSDNSDNIIKIDTVSKSIESAFNVSIKTLQHDKAAIHFYTGLENYNKFIFVFNTLGPPVDHLNYIYNKKPTKISVLDQFFLTLMILRQNKTYYEVSLFFNIDLKEVSNIFITWIRFMYLQWSEISQWSSKELVNFYMPSDFKKKFPGTRGILDGTEIPIEKPSLPLTQQSTFSTYKNKNTVKTIICASPGGLITNISPAYGGSTSDRAIMERSNLIKSCDPGDVLMADKGFDIQDLLAPYGITLNIPAFFKKKNQLSRPTLMKNEKISSKRVHIERLIGLGKTYKILEGPLTSCQTKIADDIIFVCFMLCNFRKPIISKNA